jgi:tetratricopeptide (TPR) repeat protein
LEHPSRVPSKELPPDTDLQRAPLLDAQVEIEIAAGDLPRARAAADELERIAARFQSKALLAAASLGRGRVCLADGDAGMAEALCSEAVALWNEIRAPYEGAVARTVLADALNAAGRTDRAALESEAAQKALTQIENAATRSPPARVFRREADGWLLEFESTTARLRDLKGLHHLAVLLDHPGREFHVLDLVAMETGQPVPPGDAGEMLDADAKALYRRRLEEIDDDIEQARALGDEEREVQAETERDFLLRELARAVGLGGRDRRAASASERARVRITRAIRQAIARIDEHHAALGEHLGGAIRTGTYCAYIPEPGDTGPWQR